tara:strand:- start:1972 stop:2772 length:801 start_codon:yes stop_codon:yes gene_type:complete
MSIIKETGYLPCYAYDKQGESFSKDFPDDIQVTFDWTEHDPKAKYNIYVQCEPPTMWVDRMKILEPIKNQYDLFLGYQEEILEYDNAEFFLPVGGWINSPPDIEKKPQVSFVTSSKVFTDAHRMRFMIMRGMGDTKNFNGLDYQFYRSPPSIIDRDSYYTDSMFNIACENELMNNMFTEKLIDCLACKTIPIYYGCQNIEKFFNPKGILSFNTYEEYVKIIKNVNEDMYYNMLPYVEENFEISKQYWQKSVYERIEDLILEKYYAD